MRLYIVAEDLAPPGVLQNSQFLRPITNGFIERSARLFDISIVSVQQEGGWNPGLQYEIIALNQYTEFFE